MARPTQCVVALLALLAGCGEESASSISSSEAGVVKEDFSTPEGAILSLEDAYRRKDIEAAVRCKDFRAESRLMLLSKTKIPADQVDDELVAKTAEVLELAYRKQFEQQGFPDLAGVKSTFPAKERRQDGIVLVTEVCKYPDGGSSTQRILVAETPVGWRVLNAVQ